MYAVLKYLISYPFSHKTVVLDCCHSGSGTRKVRDSATTVRGVVLPESTQADILGTGTRGSGLPKSDADREYTKSAKDRLLGSFSHVLLAACSAQQSSSEALVGGKFTTALLKVLQGSGTDQLTYRRLIENLESIPE